MLPTCREVSEQASENLDEPVKGTKWLKLKLHLLICAYCRRYNQQIGLARETVKSLADKKQCNQTVKAEVEKAYKGLHGKK